MDLVADNPMVRNEKCDCTVPSLPLFFDYHDPYSCSELVSLVAQSDVKSLEKYVGGKKTLSITDWRGNSPLHLSIIFNKVEVFDYLMTLKHTNVNARNCCHQTPIHMAVITESEYFVRRLIQKGADVNSTDWNYCTPLHAASARYLPKICSILLSNGARIDAQNLRGKTGLFHACRYAPLDSIHMLLYHGASARIPDVVGALPLFAVMQRHFEDRPPDDESIKICHEVLFNHTFDQDYSSVNLTNIAIALKTDSFLIRKILRKVNHVSYSDHELAEFSRCVVNLKSSNFILFARRFSNVVKEMLQEPRHLHHNLAHLEDCDAAIIRFMAFMSILFELRPSFNFVKRSSRFPYFVNDLINLYKDKKLSMGVLEQMLCFLYSHGLPCELWHLVVFYETFGFCDIVKFILDLDITVTNEQPRAVMPYLLNDLHLTIDKFMELMGRPCTRHRAALRYFASGKVRSFFAQSRSRGFRKKLAKMPTVPSLLQLARDSARKHIIHTFEIEKSRDFYRLLRKMPINAIYKKILTYEKEVYKF